MYDERDIFSARRFGVQVDDLRHWASDHGVDELADHQARFYAGEIRKLLFERFRRELRTGRPSSAGTPIDNLVELVKSKRRAASYQPLLKPKPTPAELAAKRERSRATRARNRERERADVLAGRLTPFGIGSTGECAARSRAQRLRVEKILREQERGGRP